MQPEILISAAISVVGGILVVLLSKVWERKIAKSRANSDVEIAKLEVDSTVQGQLWARIKDLETQVKELQAAREKHQTEISDLHHRLDDEIETTGKLREESVRLMKTIADLKEENALYLRRIIEAEGRKQS
jgi:predicted transcriptional regulator